MGVATFLDGTAVTQQRGLAWLALSAAGQIISAGGTSDAGGGITGGSATLGSSFACRIDPLAGGETPVAGRISDRSTHLVTVPSEITVDIANQVKVDDDVFEITAIRSRTRALFQVLEAVEAS